MLLQWLTILVFTLVRSSLGWIVQSLSHVHNCRSLLATSTSTTALFAASPKNLISVQGCLEVKDDVVFVDGSWYHKGNRNGRQDFEQGPRLPGARYIDMDDLSCQKELFPELNPKGLDHMLPPARLFALAMDEFGITNSDHVIVYGRKGSVFTPRTWFLFRSMGHGRVSLMQGSLEDWQAAGGVVEEGCTTVPCASEILAKGGEPAYQASDPINVVTMQDVLEALQQDTIILDPRGSSFQHSGHIPGAIHIPYTSLVQEDNELKLKSREELLRLFADAGVEIRTDKTIITSCGSGVSVCHILLALEECGRDLVSQPTFMYDGSWAEWGTDPGTPKILPRLQ